jgi:hypothetical protein
MKQWRNGFETAAKPHSEIEMATFNELMLTHGPAPFLAIPASATIIPATILSARYGLIPSNEIGSMVDV